MKSLIKFTFTFFISLIIQAQEKLSYYKNTVAPKEYTATSVASRMVDGLGCRYYWATEKFRFEYLAYKPSEKGRSAAETVDYILGLSKVILNCVTEKVVK